MIAIDPPTPLPFDEKAEGDRHPKRKRGRPVGDRDAKRAELLAAATTVIARAGYAGAGLRKVAQHAGCTTGAVTYYFANKEEMIAAVVQHLFDEFDSLLLSSGDDWDLRSFIEQYLNRAESDEYEFPRVLIELLAAARHEPAFAGIVQERYARYRKRFAALMALGQQKGVIRDDIPAEFLADQINGLGDGWTMMLTLEPDRFKSERFRQLVDATATLFSAPGARKS